MNGAELAQKILAQIPTARIVFVTAFAKSLKALRAYRPSEASLKPVNGAKLTS